MLIYLICPHFQLFMEFMLFILSNISSECIVQNKFRHEFKEKENEEKMKTLLNSYLINFYS